MSNAESEEVVSITRDGVTVRKSFEPDDFPVPAIAFEVRSERAEPVSVRMVDSVPEDVPAEDIGFHPKYGAEHWSVEGSNIVFERRFEADEEYTTVYGLRGGDAEEAERFMTEPELESIDPPLSEDSGQVVRDVIGDTTADDEPSDDDIASAIAAADSTDDAAENGVDDETHDPVVDGSVAPDDDEVGEAVPQIELSDPVGGAESSLVSSLAAEIRTGEVDDDELDVLRDALGETSNGSVDARIEHLQTKVSDLEAYTTALESFLDENGDAQTLLRELRTEFEEATETVEETEQRVDEALEGIDERVDERLEEADERLEEQVGSMETRIETANEQIETQLESTETRLDEALEGIDEQVHQHVEDEVDELWIAVDEATADAADVADDVEELRDELEAIEESVGDDLDERLEEFESELDELSAELSDLAEMRDRLTSAFTAIGGHDVTDDSDDSDE